MGNAWREAMARVAARRRSRTARASGGKVGRQVEEAAHPEKCPPEFVACHTWSRGELARARQTRYESVKP